MTAVGAGLGALGLFLAVVALLVVRLRRRYVVVTVDGESMLPAFRPGERLLVRRTAGRSLQVGQVVVLSGFAHARPGRRAAGKATRSSAEAATGPKWIVKRIAAVPGDPIPRASVPALREVPGTHVPPGHLVVLGDNAAHSHDSRHTGYLTTDRLLGVVLRTVAPRLHAR